MGWHLHLDVILWVALFQGGYLYALRAVGRPRGLKAARTQLWLYTSGVAVLYLAAGTPIHDLAEHRLFMIHMVQHLLITLVAPPLMLLGLPGWLIEPLLDRIRIFRIARALTLPFVAFMSFNLVTLVTHLPPVVDMSLRQHWFHFVVHTILISSASLMWWPVASPTARLPRLAPALQMVYLFLQSFVPTVLASFITFSSTVFYTFYNTVPRTWGLSAVDDQRNAGLIMKLGGGAILWIAIAIVFFTWVSREERKAAEPALVWDDVEDELKRMGLTKTTKG